jgi:uncharacterized protein
VIGYLSLLLGFLALAAFLRILGWLWYLPVSSRFFGEYPWIAERESALPQGDQSGQQVEFLTRDGVVLVGNYLPTAAARRRGVILYCHEFNGHRWNAAPYAEALRPAGFDLFTFDFRSHGASARTPGYDPTPWVSQFEVLDVTAAIDYLTARSDADPQGIGLLGVNKGGTAGLCAAAIEPRVRALVVDGVCPTERMQVYHTRLYLEGHRGLRSLARLPAGALRLLGRCARAVIGRRRHCRFVNVDQAAQDLSQPVLLIHGQCDTYVPVNLVRSLRRSMKRAVKRWIVPHARHNGTDVAAGPDYHQRIVQFFASHLDMPSRIDGAPVTPTTGPHHQARTAATASASRRAEVAPH